MKIPVVAPLVLMVIVSCGFFGLLAILAFHQVPDQNKDILEGMLGVLGTSFVSIIGHYFGSASRRSENPSGPIPGTPVFTPPVSQVTSEVSAASAAPLATTGATS